jgi:hypothetical protein
VFSEGRGPNLWQIRHFHENMNRFPRLPAALGGAAIALAAAWAVSAQDNPGPPADGPAESANASDPPDSASPQPSTLSPQPSDAGVQLLQQSRDKLIDQPLEATLVEDVMIGKGRFKATGRYVQGPNLKLRLEFKVKVGQTEGTLLEVCDGQILWTQQKTGDRPRITRRDVREILDAASRAGHLDDNLLTAELGLGGLPALLASIERHMVLAEPREETIDGQTVHVLEGTWNDEFLKRYRSGPDAPRELPSHVPDRALVYLDSELYPRRIVYRKAPAGADFDVPLLTLDFKDFRLNPRIDESEFQFKPERGVFPEDITREYLDRLRPPAQAAGPR